MCPVEVDGLKEWEPLIMERRYNNPYLSGCWAKFGRGERTDEMLGGQWDWITNA